LWTSFAARTSSAMKSVVALIAALYPACPHGDLVRTISDYSELYLRMLSLSNPRWHVRSHNTSCDQSILRPDPEIPALMTRDFIEREIDGTKFRVSVRRPEMGQPVIRYQVLRYRQGREFWATIRRSSKLLVEVKAVFADDLKQAVGRGYCTL
jgi:hypothetical protein